MEVTYDLDKLERKTATAIYQDGIFDLTLGHVLIAFGIASFLYSRIPNPIGYLSGFIIYLVVAIPLWLVQIFVTKPRLGIIKFGLQRKKRNMLIMGLVAFILLANIIVLILIITHIIEFGGSVYIVAVVIGLIPLIVFTLMAYLMGFTRLYFVGSLFSLGFFLKELLTIQNYELIGNIIFISIGVMIVAVGLVYLIRFFKKYPKIKVENHELEKNANQ